MIPAQQTPGHLANNLLHFGRLLRDAGLPVGTDRIALAQQALQLAGMDSRLQFRTVLAACLLGRAEHRALFDQAFDLFWRDPDLEGRMRAMLLPKVQAQPGALPPTRENRRLGEAMFPHAPQPPPPPGEHSEVQLDASLTFSPQERLRQTDFDTMTAAEWAQARQAVTRLRPLLPPLPTRRLRPTRRARAPGARPDWRASLAAQARRGGDSAELRWCAPAAQPAPLVVLADISGSMSRYSRMLLHLAHALSQGPARVHSFVFGTRLSHITRLLASRDPDLAVGEVARRVQDWAGGTRLTACLREFNHRWARRVLGSRATVLLVTDGLEHGDTTELAFEAERLGKSCRRLVWLNPLLRYSGFEPRAAGMRALLPQVHAFVPAHNLQSLQELLQLLAQGGRRPRDPNFKS